MIINHLTDHNFNVHVWQNKGLAHIFRVEFFAFNTKLPETAILASGDFTAAKKVTSSEAS